MNYQAPAKLIKLQKCEIDDAKKESKVMDQHNDVINNVLEYPSQLQEQNPI